MSDDDDDEYRYDVNNRQPYDCVNEGCQGQKVFWHNSERWFSDQGIKNLPKNCKPCKRWIEAEKRSEPVVAKCRYCGYTWSIDASYRIMYHRNYGNWDDYWEDNEDLQMCRRCAEVPSRRRRLARNLAEREYRDPAQRKSGRDQLIAKEKKLAARLQATLEAGKGSDPKNYQVPDAVSFYHQIATRTTKVGDHGPTQLTHIMKSEHNWAEKFGTEDPNTILNLSSRIAASSESHIRQYVSGKNVIKYDTQQQIVVIVVGDKASLTQNRIETSFPTDPTYVLKQIEKKRWK